MGFRGYYRRFEDIEENELNRERRARRAEERRSVLERLPDLDLSGMEWPELPHSEIVNAAIARARALVNRCGATLAQALRRQDVIVAPGGPLGADDHVRATVLDERATDRLLRAYELAVG